MLINRLFKDYKKGFYVFAPKESRITSRHRVSKYVARYVRHPAIANSRICGYDGAEVTFWYIDRDGSKHYKTDKSRNNHRRDGIHEDDLGKPTPIAASSREKNNAPSVSTRR